MSKSETPDRLSPARIVETIIGGVIVTLIGIWIGKALSASPDASSGETAAGISQPSSPWSTQATSDAINPPQEVVAPVSQAPADTLVTSLEAINRSLDVDLDEVVAINGSPYLHSIVYWCTDFCNESTASVEYDLGRDYSQFTAMIGVTDDAEDASQTGAFEVFVDNQLVGSWTASLGSPQQISVDVSGGLRLRLEWARSGTVAGGPADALQAGANAALGVSNGLPDLVWGQPTLLP